MVIIHLRILTIVGGHGDRIHPSQQRQRRHPIGDRTLPLYRRDVQAGELGVRPRHMHPIAPVNCQPEDRPLHPLRSPIVQGYSQHLTGLEMLCLLPLAVQELYARDLDSPGTPPPLTGRVQPVIFGVPNYPTLACQTPQVK